MSRGGGRLTVLVLPLAGGAGSILRGTEGLFRSDREQARLRELPPDSALPSSVLGELELSSSLALLLAPSSSAAKIVQNKNKIQIEITDQTKLAQKQDGHVVRGRTCSNRQIQKY